MITTQEVATQYYELLKQDKRKQIQNDLYDENIVCIEPKHAAAMGVPTITKG